MTETPHRSPIRRVAHGLALLIKIVGSTGFALLMLVVALALVALKWPHLVINERTLAWAADQAGRRGVARVTWDHVDVAIESSALLTKRIAIDVGGLCVRVPPDMPGKTGAPEDRELDACFPKFAVAAKFTVDGFKPRLLEAGPVDVRGARVNVKPKPAKEEAGIAPDKGKEASDSEAGVIPGWAAHAVIHPIRIEILEARYVAPAVPTTTWIASGTVVSDEIEGRARIGGDLLARTEGPAPIRDGAIQFEVTNPKGFWKLESWALNGDARTTLADGGRAHAKVELEPRVASQADHPDFNYRVDGAFERAGINGQPKLAVTAAVRGDASLDGVHGVVTASAAGVLPPGALIGPIRVRECSFGVARHGESRERGRITLDCPVRARLELPPKGMPKGFEAIQIPTEVGVLVKADVVSSRFPPGADSRLEGGLGLELKPILSPIFQGGGTVSTELAGIPSRFPKDWKLDTDVNLHFGVKKFRDLVATLSRTAFAVWAPLRVLDGTVDIAAKGRVDLDGGNLPVKLVTRLSSERQKLDVDAAGELHLDRVQPSPRGMLQARVDLSDIQLELPRLEKGAPPRFVPDERIHPIQDRIQLAGIVPEEPASFGYAIDIQTPAERPVRLLSNLAKDPVPVGVQFRIASGEPAGGVIRVESFAVEFFNRKASVDHFVVDLRDPRDQRLDGEVRVPYADYVITILVIGTTSKPTVKFLSDPPLPEDQIVAALLFGAPLDGLDADQSTSVGQTEKAIANGALTLGSMYALASTPVQSVGLDPTTGDVIAKVKLGEGTTLNVGGSTEASRIGLRRRLNSRWSINTDVRRDREQGTQTASAFLEWIRRY